MGEIAFVWVVILLTAIQNFAYKVLHIALFLTVELNYPVLKKVETSRFQKQASSGVGLNLSGNISILLIFDAGPVD